MMVVGIVIARMMIRCKKEKKKEKEERLTSISNMY